MEKPKKPYNPAAFTVKLKFMPYTREAEKAIREAIEKLKQMPGYVDE